MEHVSLIPPMEERSTAPFAVLVVFASVVPSTHVRVSHFFHREPLRHLTLLVGECALGLMRLHLAQVVFDPAVLASVVEVAQLTGEGRLSALGATIHVTP